MITWGGLREWAIPALELLTIAAAAWIAQRTWGH